MAHTSATHNRGLPEILLFSEKLPYGSKVANSHEWLKRRIDAVINSYPLDKDYQEKTEDNFRMLSGLAPIHFKKKSAELNWMEQNDLISEGIDAPNLQMEYHDVVSPMVEGLVGDQQRRQLTFTTVDQSLYTQNYIKDEEDRLLTTYFQQKIIQPANDQIQLQWQIEHQVPDLMQLSPEERQQMQTDVAQRLDAITPKDIKRYLKHGAKGRLEIAGQAIAEHFVSTTGLKFIADQAYYWSYATGGLIFRQGVRRNEQFIEAVDLMAFNTEANAKLFINNNPWYTYHRKRHPADIWNDYSDQMNQTETRNFDKLIRGVQGNTPFGSQRDHNFLMALKFDDMQQLSNIDMKTKQGQLEYRGLEQRLEGTTYKDFEKMDEINVVFLSRDKVKKVQRVYPDGTIRYDYHDEHYQFSKQHGDIDVKTVWPMRYWQGTRIGHGEEAVYVDKGPVPFQQRKITDPYLVRSPYIGAYYNDLGGRGYRTAALDKVKSDVHAVNFTMNAIKDREATDIGKVMLMTVAAKPKKWSWGKMLRVIRQTKMIPIDTKMQGLSAADVAFFREIDLSNMNNLVSHINYLTFLITRIADTLAWNAARSGQVAASTSVTNNISNLNRSFAQTQNYVEWFDRIMEMAIENGIYLGKMTAKRGNVFLRRVLDDLSIATIDVDINEIDDAYYNVKVVADEVMSSQIDIAKNISQTLLQGDPANMGPAVRMIFAKTRGEIDTILTDAEMAAEIRASQSAEINMQNQEMQIQLQKDMLEFKNELEKTRDALNNEAKKEMAALNSMTIAHGNDVDGNKENDYLEAAREDRKFKYDELQMKDKWKSAELEALRQKKAATKPARTP